MHQQFCEAYVIKVNNRSKLALESYESVCPSPQPGIVDGIETLLWQLAVSTIKGLWRCTPNHGVHLARSLAWHGQKSLAPRMQSSASLASCSR